MIKELEDFTWFPAILRKQQTGFIGFLAGWLQLYKPLVSVLQKSIAPYKNIVVYDLCSGNGAPAVYMHKQLQDFIKQTILSDKFPDNSFTNTTTITYNQQPADITTILPQPGYCYTMYNAFHHFNHKQKIDLLQKMYAAKAPFLFAEILQPGPVTLIKIIFTTTVGQLLLAPFVKPFSWRRIFFTYIIPVNIFTVCYDGIVSVCKSKTITYYQLLANTISNSNYKVEAHKMSSLKANIIYITGTPVAAL